MQAKKKQLELDMEQWTGSKLGKEEEVKSVYCHPAYLTYMQSTAWEMPAEWITSWNQNFQEKYQQPQRWYHSNDVSEEELKSLLMKVKEENEKVGLKLSI